MKKITSSELSILYVVKYSKERVLRHLLCNEVQFLGGPLGNSLFKPIGDKLFLSRHELSPGDDGEPRKGVSLIFRAKLYYSKTNP